MSAPPPPPLHLPPNQSHTHRDLGLIKRLLNPEEVCVRSFRGTILTSEYNLELGPPPLWFPLSHYWTILPPGSLSPGSFSCFSLPPFQDFFGLSSFQRGSPGLLSLSLTHTTESDSKRLVCKASLEFICLNRFISPPLAPSLCPLLGKWVLA